VLGNPMEKIKLLAVGNGLEVERALTDAERRRMLGAIDALMRSTCLAKSRGGRG